MASTSNLDQARVVIIGGGIVGCSIAYHLAKMGEKDVLLLEKGELTSGSTWHAAGLVGQLRSSRNITRMLKYSVELYNKLESETGQATGWRPVGGLRIASTKDRMIELKKAATTAKTFGLEMQLLTPDEAVKLFPLMTKEKMVGAAFLPTDGYTDPSSTANALGKGARMHGARIRRNIRVTGVETQEGTHGREIKAVLTDQGRIACEIIVNAAGNWARKVGQMAGVNVPVIPLQHQYIVTEAIPNMPKGLPTMRDPDHLVYYKEEVDGLVMGGYEPKPLKWHSEGAPFEFGQELLEPDYDHFQQISDLALIRTPILEKVGIRKLINGPEAFTSDGTFIMGEAPELRHFFVAAGFNAHGIAAGGGAGKMMAEWILHGEPSLQLWEVDIRRFGGYHHNLKYVEERTCELYGKHYTIAWPHEEHQSGRGIRKSPLYDTLKSQGAVFGAKFGWERPNWFAPKGVEAKDKHTFGRPNCFDHVAEEHRTIREGVGLIDQTSFSKFELSGNGAVEFANWIAANQVDKPIGSLTYTQLCNEKGGIEADLTFGRVGENRFYIVTGTAFTTHDFHWIAKHLPRGVELRDITNTRGVINVCGPKSRELLSRVTSTDLSLEKFPFATCQEIQIGYAQALALRVTYVGELGWELHIPMEQMSHVYEKLWEAGQDLGVKNCGYRAIESCRLEKGYRYWSTDLTPDYNPYEAGLGFCVSLKKPGDFLGRKALETIKAKGPKQTLSCFTIESEIHFVGGESIQHQGKILGVVSSGGFGHTLKKSIAYGYIPTETATESRFEIEHLGERYPAIKQNHVLYDPKRERILQ